MPSPFAIISQALKENLPEVRSKSWRESMRARLPPEKLFDILARFAEGRPWFAELPDGKCSAPIIPSSDVCLRAAMFLHETLHGKAVAQTEIQKAEKEAQDFEAVRALDDDELERRAAKILEARRVERLSHRGTSDAEFTEIDLRIQDAALSIWASPAPGVDDDE